MKRAYSVLISFLLVFVLCFSFASCQPRLKSASDGVVYIPDEPIPLGSMDSVSVAVDGGYIVVRIVNTTGKQVQVMFNADGKQTNQAVKTDGTENRITPPFGSGTYTVRLLERIDPNDNRYSTLHTATVNVAMADTPSAPIRQQPSGSAQAPSSTNPYLGSSVEVNWSTGLACVKKATELCANQSTNSGKAKAIYKYLNGILTYDMSKLGKLPGGYKPSPDSTFSSQMGICYDMAALYAAMLRSQGVPAKLCKGYSDNVDGYHAWNQVDMDGSWSTVDLSVDAQLRAMGRSYSMVKKDSIYRVSSSF